MKTTTRYSLIILSILIFLVLAPLLILYVSGRRIDLSSRETSATGILDAKSNPAGATLTIDDADRGTTPAIARFLNQGEYKVILHKDGYYDWVKKLPIEQGKVNYAQVGVDAVQLIKKTAAVTLAPNGVSSFVLVNDFAWYVKDRNIIKISVSDPTRQATVALPASVTKPNLTVLRDKHHIYLGQGNILNTDDNSIVAVPVNFGATEQPNNISVTPNNIFIYADGKGLRAYDPSTKKVTDLITTPVTAFTMIDNTGYFIESDNVNDATPSLMTAVWNGVNFNNEAEQILIAKQVALAGTQNSLYITDGKALFCNCSGKLYKVNQQLDLLNDNVLGVNLDLSTNELNFRTSSELWFYNFLANQPQLLARSAGGANDLLIRSAIGYGFAATKDGLEAIEIDNRDKQNRYQLLGTGKAVWEVAMTANQKTIVALQDGALVSLEIRN